MEVNIKFINKITTFSLRAYVFTEKINGFNTNVFCFVLFITFN